ncbi:MAG: dynamin family protein [Syntrophobacteraceae bacterium]
MNEHFQLKEEIQGKLGILKDTIRELEKSELVQQRAAFLWRKYLDQVEASLQDSLLSIAVVGSVKSGKSTLINALIGRDILKRGAGIVTAFITRIRTYGELGGWVELKPWSQIHDELNSSLELLPSLQEEFGKGRVFDIRKAEDRDEMKLLLDAAGAFLRQTGGRLDPNFLLLNGYLEGYKSAHCNMGDEVNRLIFDEHSLAQHQRYVSQESQAVYLRDMQINCPVPWLGEKVEVADCQGSDSPNPLHYARLQEYLLKCHFILYVISSRTGLRETDFKLLDFIKSLHMFPRTFFILNVDLDEHPQVEDLDRAVDRVRKELGWVVPEPRLFAFSGLYHLIDELGDGAEKREKRHLTFWKEDQPFIARTVAEYGAFRDEVRRSITGRRSRILLGTGLARLSLTASGIMDAVNTQKRFMDRNLGDLRKSAGKIKKKHDSLQGALATLENAVAGQKKLLEIEMDVSVEDFFHPKGGAIVKETLDMVELYAPNQEDLKELSDFSGLLACLHKFYLEFRQSLSRFLVEKVNLKVIEFAKSQEDHLRERLTGLSKGFGAIFASVVEDYRQDMAQFKIDLQTPSQIRDWDHLSCEIISPPTFSAFVDQDAVSRGILLIKFGLGRLTRFLAGLKRRTGKTKDFLMGETQKKETVEEAIRLVKLEARSELIHAFERYRDNFKSEYLYRIVEESMRQLLSEFRARADMTELDLTSMLKQSELEGEERQAVIETLSKAGDIVQGIVEELTSLELAFNQ